MSMTNEIRNTITEPEIRFRRETDATATYLYRSLRPHMCRELRPPLFNDKTEIGAWYAAGDMSQGLDMS
jgi:hypothetical protein